MIDLAQRYDYLNTLLAGWGSEADGRSILALFESASPDDRRELYRYLEHHPWSGDFA